ncbi:Lrp/AsnC family transcriptional regulator [Halomicrobium salinisoli]|uniref:Lrp/AsnC family transcriptional regulator n=1 Tax=Halomicrobium salinisoli TaxID=2878391 RepID=UPI001CF0908A|nr:winged helix-turn-helix transcriptional regulator [Halomicrobium salinisoli]
MAELDEVDRGILHLLQSDARNQTPVDMAESLPVSAQTVRNRIEKLEDRGVIEGYVPVIDYEEAEFPMRVKFACTAPVDRREELAEEALEISNVVHVEEMLSARRNLLPLAVTRNAEEITSVTEALDDLGLRIESERLLRTRHRQPFDHFGEDAVSDG